jgi:hypothetical protein
MVIVEIRRGVGKTYGATSPYAIIEHKDLKIDVVFLYESS